MRQGYAGGATGCSGCGATRHNRGVKPNAHLPTSDDDLPLVRHGLPLPLRVVFAGFGVFAMVMPAWELGRGLWPLSIATPVFAIIIGGAASVGIAMHRAALAGESQAWTFPRNAVVIHHKAWRSAWNVRLTAHDIAAIEVRRFAASEGEDPWRVVIVPKASHSGLRMAGRNGVFETGDYTSAAYAEKVRRALLAHLQLR